jgi:hypothetical protein
MMYPYWVLGINFLGTKAIIGYIIVIVVVVAVAVYMRRGNAR